MLTGAATDVRSAENTPKTRVVLAPSRPDDMQNPAAVPAVPSPSFRRGMAREAAPNRARKSRRTLDRYKI